MTRLRKFLKVSDSWLLFVVLLLACAPEPNYDADIILPVIGAFLIAEPRLKVFQSRNGQILSLAIKLVLSYLLVGFTHASESYYYQIFLIPVVSAATSFGLVGVLSVTVIAGLAYFSLLLPFIRDYERFPLQPDEVSVMSLRVVFFAIVAVLVYEQARAKRLQIVRAEETSAKLAESNRNLQEAQVSLRRSERLAALGQLTAGLAHELRNPLGTIKASAEMLTKQQKPEIQAEMSEYIGSEVNRMNGLITSFLNFARPLQTHPAEADLNAVVDDVMRQQAELAKQRQVYVLAEKPGASCRFSFDRDLLTVALTNLVQNAIQASEAGKAVTLRIERAAQEVKIWVTDQGVGIPAQNLESIFNPFFTTKPEGVGLGLPIVAKIIDEHQGRIDVRSEEHKGTTFEVVLPFKS